MKVETRGKEWLAMQSVSEADKQITNAAVGRRIVSGTQ